MTTPGGAIEFEFRGNLAPLKRDLNQAANIAKQSTAQVNRATHGGAGGGVSFFEQPHLRSERRVATAARLFATNIGSIQTGADGARAALQALEGSFNIGFGATVLATAGIAIYEKWTEQINSARKAHTALSEEISKPIAGLSESALGQRLEATQKLTADAVGKEKAFFPTLQARLGAGFGALIHGRSPGEAAHTSAAQLGKEDKEAGTGRRYRILRAMSDRAEEEADQTEAGIKGSDRDAAATKIRRGAGEKVSQLLSDRSSDPFENMQMFRRLGAINKQRDLEIGASDQIRFQITRRAFTRPRARPRKLRPHRSRTAQGKSGRQNRRLRRAHEVFVAHRRGTRFHGH